MADKVTSMLREGKIDLLEYDTYVLFELNELGRNYLKNMIESVFLEEPAPTGNHSYARAFGKQSAWREIKTIINLVNLKLAEYEDD